MQIEREIDQIQNAIDRGEVHNPLELPRLATLRPPVPTGTLEVPLDVLIVGCVLFLAKCFGCLSPLFSSSSYFSLPNSANLYCDKERAM